MPNLPKSRRPHWIPKKESKPYTGEKFYQTPAWRNLRNKYIAEHPLCEECERLGIKKVGKVVDHITPIRFGGEALDENNLQTLCVTHHAMKTGREVHRK